MAKPVIIKKYGNRRLYDTGESRYVTLDELATKVREGTDVKVIDAKSGDDLTQVTLTQIVIESRGAAHLLPVPLLTQLIRLGDDALAEFFGRWVTGALDMYLQAKRSVRSVAAYNPLAAMPLAATDALARMWMSSPFGRDHAGPRSSFDSFDDSPGAEPVDEEHEEEDAMADEVADLRRELEELKRSMKGMGSSEAPKPRSGKGAKQRSGSRSSSSRRTRSTSGKKKRR